MYILKYTFNNNKHLRTVTIVEEQTWNQTIKWRNSDNTETIPFFKEKRFSLSCSWIDDKR